jgi:hypothetical protein
MLKSTVPTVIGLPFTVTTAVTESGVPTVTVWLAGVTVVAVGLPIRIVADVKKLTGTGSRRSTVAGMNCTFGDDWDGWLSWGDGDSAPIDQNGEELFQAEPSGIDVTDRPGMPVKDREFCPATPFSRHGHNENRYRARSATFWTFWPATS